MAQGFHDEQVLTSTAMFKLETQTQILESIADTTKFSVNKTQRLSHSNRMNWQSDRRTLTLA